MIQELEPKFQKGIYEFRLYKKNNTGFIYSVYEIEANRFSHYEVFERKITPLCIDFEKKIYSDVDFKVRYPKDEDFGIWAFCVKNIELAYDKLNSFEHVN